MSDVGAHNTVLLPVLRLIAGAAEREPDQWVILESICLSIGRLHGRSARETALLIEKMAERFIEGARGE